MRHWQAGVLVAVVALGYFLFSYLSSTRGSFSFGVANVAGLAVVVIGVAAAGLIFRRATPHT